MVKETKTKLTNIKGKFLLILCDTEQATEARLHNKKVNS